MESIHEKGDLEYFAIYSEKCLRCSHLVEGAKKTFNKCHFRKGNDQCPAVAVKILSVGKIKRYANLIRKARVNKDPSMEQKVWTALTQESPAFLTRFYEYLNDNL